MMNMLIRRISILSQPMWNVIVSAVGGFVFIQGLRPFAVRCSGSGTAASLFAAATSSKLLAGSSAAVFLLAFIASEAMVAIRAFCR